MSYGENGSLVGRRDPDAGTKASPVIGSSIGVGGNDAVGVGLGSATSLRDVAATSSTPQTRHQNRTVRMADLRHSRGCTPNERPASRALIRSTEIGSMLPSEKSAKLEVLDSYRVECTL